MNNVLRITAVAIFTVGFLSACCSTKTACKPSKSCCATSCSK